MPLQRNLYPDDWETIALACKERDNWVCQHCGKQCRKPGEPFDTHRRTATAAHVDHLKGDHSLENLITLCAPCHLRYDKDWRRLMGWQKRLRAALKPGFLRLQCGGGLPLPDRYYPAG